MGQIIFYIIITIIILEYLADRWLEYLNRTKWTHELPAELEGIYDKDKYRKSQEYLRANTKFGEISSTVSLFLILVVLFLHGFAYIDSLARDLTDNPILQALFFFGIIGLASDIVATPFSVYSNFVIEKRFGFNRMTVKTYITDKMKGWLVGGIIGGVLLAAVAWVYMIAGNWFWLLAWAVIGTFSVIMTMFYSEVIVPLFNKQTPLEDGELRDAIEKFSGKTGFRLNNIFVIDGSKRSTKANAYFSGLGKKKRIVLYDTLIKEHSVDEIVAVLAHEIGHYKKKHTLTGTLIGLAQTGLLLFILSLFLDNPALANALGADQPSFHIGILAFALLYSPVSTMIDILTNSISRKHEYEADRFAGENYNPESLKQALKKLSVTNLSNLRPHPAFVFVHYSHPPVLKRLEHLDQVARKN